MFPGPVFFTKDRARQNFDLDVQGLGLIQQGPQAGVGSAFFNDQFVTTPFARVQCLLYGMNPVNELLCFRIFHCKLKCDPFFSGASPGARLKICQPNDIFEFIGSATEESYSGR